MYGGVEEMVCIGADDGFDLVASTVASLICAGMKITGGKVRD